MQEESTTFEADKLFNCYATYTHRENSQFDIRRCNSLCGTAPFRNAAQRTVFYLTLLVMLQVKNILLVVNQRLIGDALALLVESLDPMFHTCLVRHTHDVLTVENKEVNLFLVYYSELKLYLHFARKLLSPNARLNSIALIHPQHLNSMPHLISRGFSCVLTTDGDSSELKNAITSLFNSRNYYDDIAVRSPLQPGLGKVNFSDSRLSLREEQVLSLLAKGLTNKEICIFLGLSVRTIESYRKTLMKKLHCHNVAEVVHYAFRTGRIAE